MVGVAIDLPTCNSCAGTGAVLVDSFVCDSVSTDNANLAGACLRIHVKEDDVDVDISRATVARATVTMAVEV